MAIGILYLAGHIVHAIATGGFYPPGEPLVFYAMASERPPTQEELEERELMRSFHAWEEEQILLREQRWQEQMYQQRLEWYGTNDPDEIRAISDAWDEFQAEYREWLHNLNDIWHTLTCEEQGEAITRIEENSWRNLGQYPELFDAIINPPEVIPQPLIIENPILATTANFTAAIPLLSEPLPHRAWTEADAIGMARMVWGEARGTSREEQALVIWTALQRVEDDRYHNTILGVIRAHRQFVGYRSHFPVWDCILELVIEQLTIWEFGGEPPTHTRYAPSAPYFYFDGDGRNNWFRENWR